MNQNIFCSRKGGVKTHDGKFHPLRSTTMFLAAKWERRFAKQDRKARRS